MSGTVCVCPLLLSENCSNKLTCELNPIAAFIQRSSSVIRLHAKMVAPVLKTVGDTHVPVSQASKESIAQVSSIVFD